MKLLSKSQQSVKNEYKKAQANQIAWAFWFQSFSDPYVQSILRVCFNRHLVTDKNKIEIIISTKLQIAFQSYDVLVGTSFVIIFVKELL